jgi:ABC-type glycerol-3-phosphate transport system substrate-binding protein
VPGSAQVFDYRTGDKKSIGGSNHIPYLGAGGWICAVPRSSGRAEAAFALAAALGDPKTSRDIVIEPAWGGGVFRRDHLDARVGWQAFDLEGKWREKLVEVLRETVVHPQIENPVLGLRIPDEREHRLALDKEIRAALTGGKDARQALDAAAENWRQLDSAKDPQVRLAEYRLSLSLGRGK